MPQLGTNFTSLDWFIVGVYLIATICAGLYVKKYVQNMGDYVVAGRSLNSFLSIATMLGSEIGLVTVMYAAQKGFTGGLASFYIGLLGGILCFGVGLTGLFVVPLRRFNVMTIPEFYQLRFGRGVRILGGIILFFTGVLNMGMFLRAGATFLTGLTGLSDPISVNIVMTILVLIVLAYTVLGGMLSVVVTDYIQFVVLAAGFVIACLFALRGVGWANLVRVVQSVHGESGLNPIAQFGWWDIAQNALIVGIVSTAVWPTAVMRAVATTDTRVVRRLYLWSSIGFMTRWIIPQLLGVCALAFLFTHPTAKSFFFTPDNRIIPEHSLQAMPLMLSQLLPQGVIGLILAGMIAAQMSTDSSYVLCWSSVFVNDIALPILGKRLSDRAQIQLTRAIMLLIGAFLLIWSLWYPLRENLWDYLAVTGAIYFTGAIALLAGGLYWKRASTAGAYLSLASGLLCLLALEPIRVKLHLTHIAGHEINSAMIVISVTLLSLLLMVIGSLMFPATSPRAEATP